MKGKKFAMVAMVLLGLAFCALVAFAGTGDKVTTTTARTIVTSQVACSGVEAVISAEDPDRNSILIKNTHLTKDLYVGRTGVLTSTGFGIPAGSTLTLDRTYGAIYCITDGTAITAHVFVEK